MSLSVADRPDLYVGSMATHVASSGYGCGPIEFSAAASRSPWTMPTFYLVPFMCAYIFGSMWIVQALSSLRRMASRD